MLNDHGSVNWSTACKSLAVAYESKGDSSSSVIFDSTNECIRFETTLRLPVRELNILRSDHDLDYFDQSAGVEIDSSVLHSRSTFNVQLRAIVLPDPVFSVPCPYIEKVWDESGKVYNIMEFQSVIDDFQKLQPQPIQNKQPHHSAGAKESEWNDFDLQDCLPHSNSLIKDNRHYKFGRLTLESHPITGLPCFSMHMCQLQSILQLSEQTLKIHQVERGSSAVPNEADSATLYLLNWCTIVGPHFGMFISPSEYQRMASKLLERTDDMC